ncbi:alkaline phosphatase family protein [Rubrivirga sp. IMCC43871]|uniref:alkaline phosphatase family protein n=1 Tax=Rubrivirga sp. IMCC43871 TaxID=3391575 RepID=UPI00398FD70D
MLLFLFLDGVGLGPEPDNPFATLGLPAFERLAGGQRWIRAARPVRQPDATFIPIDATLGVDGLPQSGTGQAALFTGLNAARTHGNHFGPYPPTTVRPDVAEHSVFARLVAAGVPAARLAFGNAYPDRFFRAAEARGRWTVTTLAARSAGVRLRTADDLSAGTALTADLTGALWAHLLDDAYRPISEAEAAQRLAALLDAHAFVLQEYFLTDKAGHSRDPERAARVLLSLDRFLGALLDTLPDDVTLLITSDHGNIEALGTKSHTTNPVPLVAWGPGAAAFADCRSLLDVTPAIIDWLTTGDHE